MISGALGSLGVISNLGTALSVGLGLFPQLLFNTDIIDHQGMTDYLKGLQELNKKNQQCPNVTQ